MGLEAGEEDTGPTPKTTSQARQKQRVMSPKNKVPDSSLKAKFIRKSMARNPRYAASKAPSQAGLLLGHSSHRA